jgi:CHASE2 domain-containing sensor protein
MSRPKAPQRAAGIAARYSAIGKRVLHALPSIAFVVLLTLLFSRFSVFHQLEKPMADFEMSIAGYMNPRGESPIVVVDITDEDYQTLFGGKSPLNYQKLEQLINDIASFHPDLIAVDIDTSDRQFYEFTIDDRWPPIVWAREPGALGREANKLDYQPLDVLGAKDPELNRNSGVPMLMVDSNDKVARTYTRMLRTDAGLLPTFSWAVVDLYREHNGFAKADTLPRCSPQPPDTAVPDACTEALVINYISKRQCEHCFHFTASQIGSRCNRDCAAVQPWGGKIALLGGSYSDTERSKDTPIGPMSGVEVLANVIETELEGGGQPELGLGLSMAMEAFEGLVLVLLFYIFALRRALLFSVVAIPFFAWLGHLLSGRPLVFFLPILVAVLFFEWFLHYRQKLLGRLVPGKGAEH